MLDNLALVALTALILNYFFEKIKLPGIIGMMLGGMLLFNFGFVSSTVMNIGPEIRFISLFVILMRAGLGIRLKELKKVGAPALRMSFIPCLIEAAVVSVLSKYFLGFGWMESLMLGFILSAVSPAIVVPSMIDLKQKGWGKDKEIPTLILASASLDNIIAITVLTSLITFQTNVQNSGFLFELFRIPLSILSGVLLGIISAYAITKFFNKVSMRDTKVVLFIFVIGIFMHELEKYIPVSSFVAIMTLAFIILETQNELSQRLALKFSKIWVLAEIFLFSLIGMSISFEDLKSAGLIGLGIILIGLFARMFGVWSSLIGTNLKAKEKLFCMISFVPKATVQAAFGSVPLALGLPGGTIILSISIISIIISSPLGALLIKRLSPHKYGI